MSVKPYALMSAYKFSKLVSTYSSFIFTVKLGDFEGITVNVGVLITYTCTREELTSLPVTSVDPL